MAVSTFVAKLNNQDWTNKVYSVAHPGIAANQQIHVLTSDPISNQDAKRGLIIRAKFSALEPNISGAPFEILVGVEAKDASGNWYLIGYQFSPFVLMTIAPEREIVFDPTVDTFNDGIDSTVYGGDQERVRISRIRKGMPPSDFRICLCIYDRDPSGVNGFRSVTTSITGERFDV